MDGYTARLEDQQGDSAMACDPEHAAAALLLGAWRKGPKGKPVLCNACGIRFLRNRTLTKVVPKKRRAGGSCAAAPASDTADNNTFAAAAAAAEEPEAKRAKTAAAAASDAPAAMEQDTELATAEGAWDGLAEHQ
ncbi:hypothetical protein OEZ86_009417 [Tetradesmus obliquus]|nr:hypothetical protein OEZ86_009417 [Tetradesmus obliquus]